MLADGFKTAKWQVERNLRVGLFLRLEEVVVLVHHSWSSSISLSISVNQRREVSCEVEPVVIRCKRGWRQVHPQIRSTCGTNSGNEWLFQMMHLYLDCVKCSDRLFESGEVGVLRDEIEGTDEWDRRWRGGKWSEVKSTKLSNAACRTPSR